MDTYQPIYDAIRSKISNGDIGEAVQSAMRDANLSHYVSMATIAIQDAASAYGTPSAVYRPTLSVDGGQWCALYGDNLQTGVAGFGSTPAEAMSAFDAAWWGKKAITQAA